MRIRRFVLCLGAVGLGAATAAADLPDPAPAPPPAAVLPERPAVRPPAAASLPVISGLPAPGADGWVLRGEAARHPDRAALVRLGAALAGRSGRVTVEAEVSGPAADASAARRESLARAQAVRDALAEGGVDPRRVDLRPLGRNARGEDRLAIRPAGGER